MLTRPDFIVPAFGFGTQLPKSEARMLTIDRTGLALMLLLTAAAAGCRDADRLRPPAEPAAGATRSLTGMFSLNSEGAAQFTPCHTRTRVPVAPDGDFAALAAAYAQWRTSADAPLLITIDGRIAVPPGAGLADQTPALIVERFTGIWPGETCGNPGATAQLENMYWKLTRLQGRPVQVRADRREPHLVLHAPDRRLAGAGGCNTLQGSYRLDGERFACGQITTTRLACPDPQAQAQEQLFLAALARAAAWRIRGQHLELLDLSGTILLRFEERPLGY